MSALLERLHAVFDGMPIIHFPVTAVTAPTDAHRRMLADHVAALANEHNGGVLVLGIDAAHPHRVRGVASPRRWSAAIERAASELVPPVELEVEVGEDEGRTVVAA
ncbi:MAG TPA: hypothetical protein PKA64_03535, partial [Myxococcota bacterium]|nr:hypothetical protein [Myxococcota bacterium]